MDFVMFAIPFFVILMAAEFLWGHYRGKQTYRLNDTVNSLSMGLLSRVVELVRFGSAAYVISSAVTWAGVQSVDTGPLWVWVAAFVAYDFFYYWKHRMGHEWRILWASHVAHHQSEEFNLSTALRQTGTDYVGFLFYLPLYISGLPLEVVITVGSLNLLYQFWVHTEHVGKLGLLEWILITPSNHRVHHAKNPQYIDRNYGGVFIVWDRLFGTYKEEDEDEPCQYGITEALHSWNPIWANLHVWIDTAKLAWRTRNWSDKLKIWFKPPSWRPADLPQADYDWRAPKYDPETPRSYVVYAFSQYWFITAFSLGIINFSYSIPSLAALLIFGIIALSLCAQGFLLENQPKAVSIEVTRLMLQLLLVIVYPILWHDIPALVTGVVIVYSMASLIAIVSRRPSIEVPA